MAGTFSHTPRSALSTWQRNRSAMAAALVVAGLTAIAPCAAATFFVSSSEGSDTSTGRSARGGSVGGPWQTLAKVSSRRYAEGDEILFRCGDRFEGPAAVTVDLSPGRAPLRIGAYGDCKPETLPRIDGAVAATGLAAGPRGTLAAPAPDEVSQVFLDEARLPPARFPRRGYLAVAPGKPFPADDVPLDSLGGAEADLTGATLWARTQPWLIERRVIARSDNGRIRFDKPLRYPLRSPWGFYLTGKAWMLGTDEGWAWDAGSRVMTVRKGQSPGVLRWSAGTAPLLRVGGQGSAIVEKLVLTRSAQDALETYLGGQLLVRDVTIRDAGRTGIRVIEGTGPVVENCIIERTGQDGIAFDRSRAAVARRNRLRDIATDPDYPTPAFAAINATNSPGATLDGNSISGSGYHGIRFADGSTVTNNRVERACLTMTDCGALYTWRSSPKDVSAPSVVADNIVAGVIGEHAAAPTGRNWAVGIYLDDFSSNVTIAGNIIAGVQQGIYLHNAFGNGVTGNVVVDTLDAGLVVYLNAPSLEKGAQLRNSVTRNAVLGSAGEQSVLVFRHSDQIPFERFEGNVLGAPRANQASVRQIENDGSFTAPRFRKTEKGRNVVEGQANEIESDPTGWNAPRSLSPLRIEDSASSSRVVGDGYIVFPEWKDAGPWQDPPSNDGMKCTRYAFLPADTGAPPRLGAARICVRS